MIIAVYTWQKKNVFIGKDHDKRMQIAYGLSKLTLDAAIEIDRILTKTAKEYSRTHELSALIEPYEPTEKINENIFRFPYMSLWRTFRKGGQEIRTINDLSPEITKLRKSLANTPHATEEELQKLRDFLCEWMHELYVDINHRRRLVG